MDKIYKSLRICGIHLRKMLGNPRFYIAFLWFVFLIYFYVSKVKAFSIETGIKVSPWLFPLLLNQAGNQLFVIIGALLLFCDAPFINETTTWQMMRAGKRSWFWGSMLYISVLSLIYSVGLSVIPNLMLFPRVTWMEDWGQILGALAQSSAASQLGIINLDYGLMVRFMPWQAMCLKILAVWLNTVLIGELCYVFNVWLRWGSGPLAGMMMGLTPYLILRLPNFRVGYYLAPPAWMNLSMYSWNGYGTFPSPAYIYTTFAVLILGCVIFSYIGIKKKDVIPTDDL